MAYKSYSSNSPGSLMIMGEHAVLHGQPSIVAAINKQLTITLEASDSGKSYGHVEIQTQLDSNINYKTHLSELRIEQPLEYLLAVIEYFKNDLIALNYNYKFIINSEINHTMGLGSSAAIVATAIKVIAKCLNKKLDNYQILDIGRKIIKLVQGNGSGADLAASIWGGVLYYKINPIQVEVIAQSLPIVACYSGYKLSTKEVINRVGLNTEIFDKIGKLSENARACIVNKQWVELGKLFDLHYRLQQELALSDSNIDSIINLLKQDDAVLGAKISGSGLGDCVIALKDSKDLSDNLTNGLLKLNKISEHDAKLLHDVLIAG